MDVLYQIRTQCWHRCIDLKRQVVWYWGKKEQSAFEKCNELFTSDKVLVHDDPELPVTLACDASAYGIIAVLQHTMPKGEEVPMAYALLTLSLAEKKYSQIEKEALSIIFGVNIFFINICGDDHLS